jgi:predicted protein tyrosine phosphatase
MPTEIISGLWIGNMNDNFNTEFYNDNLISIVINCTIDQGFLDLPNLKKLRIPLSEIMDPNRDIYLLSQNKRKIIDFIHEHIEHANILVCCYNGVTISALIVALYMMFYGNIEKDNIRDILRSKNDKICIDYDLSIFN